MLGTLSEGPARGKPVDIPGSALTDLPRAVTLPAPDIEVWLMPLDVPTFRIEAYAALLSDNEQMRARRYHFEDDRRRHIVARGILRVLLGNALGRALLLAWTRREAILKSTGDGLRLPLDQFEVTVAPDAPPQLLNIAHGRTSDWSLYAVDPGCGFVAMVAAHRAGWIATGAMTHWR